MTEAPNNDTGNSAGTNNGTAASTAELIGPPGVARGRRLWLVALALLAAAALAWWLLGRGAGTPTTQYQTTAARNGTLVVRVTATGNLQPTNQVDVGSELSGTIEAVLVEDNDRVKKGQLLARLDLAKLNDQVARSEAALQAAEAQVLQTRASSSEARANLQRLRDLERLSQGRMPAQAELASAEAALERAVAAEASARAGVQQAQATLRSDRTNVGKASVRSPIDGVVLLRKVEPGQTVAASLQAPVLFQLAESLSQMQLQVNVDEADVGQVRAGQSASFSVDAYPERSYPAQIQRVRYGSQTTAGVVSYLTVLSVDNSDLSLRPGMTATADITTLQRENVLLVPNAALRWSPPAAAPAKKQGSLVSSLIPRPPAQPKRLASAPAKGRKQTVWVLDGQGRPQPVEVVTGPSDGRDTQIVEGALQAGQAVITDSSERAK